MNTIKQCIIKIENDEEQNFPSILDVQAKDFFIGWFKNKMTILLLMIQSPIRGAGESMKKLSYFLDELHHHFMNSRLQGNHSKLFRWLKLFVSRYPAVSMHQRKTAVQLCKKLFNLYGLPMDADDVVLREGPLPFLKTANYNAK
ncbi:MAG: hypothetical protein A3G33_02775 [Omnitrophica bacterium RIFCSPLOWO2_12_FULL_44_17]|uniref:Uncharacterized protein n=1 Tax=Candidatus Danuiimicrobium aquiferis TaxID=1801832 RepID=A0A1G1KYB7_9BACT|nr:MAG: hypothetical protein A3G33_02775 [Omnitrophica bacterium RIFCSPLOWO2_12_FULL_44_17]OGX02840.1 MAG: hypothetical protein A3J12_00170 [Omnitrophica bacterium RIFCSPLOWO2_02_FULL_44_11]